MMDKYMEKGWAYLEKQIPSVVGFCMKVVIAIVVFYVGTRLIRWLIGVFRKYLGKVGVDVGVIQFLASISKVALYVLLVFSIATRFGVTETSVAALLGTSGLTLGLGLQGGLTNLVGGIMILLFKPFQVGDYIVVGGSSQGVEGSILKIEMFYTTLSTYDNKNIVIPNGTLSNSFVTNVTAKDNRKLEIKVQISYESSISLAKSVLEKILEADTAIESEEEINVFVDELADSGAVIGIRAWVKTEDYWKTKWRINEKIKEAFDETGIKIPYPQLDVHIGQSATLDKE